MTQEPVHLNIDGAIAQLILKAKADSRGNENIERAACEQRVLPCPGMALAVLGEPDQRARAVHQHLRQRRHFRTHDAQPQPSSQ
jgi:hypothetical protein